MQVEAEDTRRRLVRLANPLQEAISQIGAFDSRQRIDWKAAADFNRFYYALVERVAGQDAAPAWKAGSPLRR